MTEQTQIPNIFHSALDSRKYELRAITTFSVGDRNRLVSGSRFGEMIAWEHKGKRNWEIQIKEKHGTIVNCFCAMGGSKTYFCSGSADKKMRSHYFDAGVTSLKGVEHDYHTGSVTSLTPVLNKDYHILSGSWDKIARLHHFKQQAKAKGSLTGAEVCTFEGHEAAIWAVCSLENGKFATGSADKSIRIWCIDSLTKKGKQEHILKMHVDCVRGLARIPQGKNNPEYLVSCANDGVICVWECGEWTCVKKLFGHSGPIYTIAYLGIKDYFVTGGSDSTVRFWSVSKGALSDKTIVFGSKISVWGLAVLNTKELNMLAVACSDRVRIFSTDANDRENKDYVIRLEQFNAELEIKSKEKFNANELPGPEVLSLPGAYGNQAKIIKFPNGMVMVYQWLKEQWECKGAPNGVPGFYVTPGKVWHTDGREYDFVPSFKIADDKPPLKVPFNRDQHPDTVVKALEDIIKNTYGIGKDAREETESKIIAELSELKSIVPAERNPAKVHLPEDFQKISVFMPNTVKSLLIKSFGEKDKSIVTSIIALTDKESINDFETLDKLADLMSTKSENILFPVLDVMRMAILREDYAVYLVNPTNPKRVDFSVFINIIGEDSLPPKVVLVALRCICNLFANTEARKQYGKFFECINNAIKKIADKIKLGITQDATQENKNFAAIQIPLQEAISKIYNNVCIENEEPTFLVDEKRHSNVVIGIVDFLMWANDFKAIYFAYQGIKNLLLHTNHTKGLEFIVRNVNELLAILEKHASSSGTEGYENVSKVARAIIESLNIVPVVEVDSG